MQTYTVLEASEKLGISTRAVQKRCLKYKVSKRNNKYLITDEHIKEWYAEIKTNEPTNEPGTQNNEPIRKRSQSGTQIDLHIQSLEIEIENLKQEVNDLKDELSVFDIAPDERLEVFTNDDYKVFEQRLNEWQTQRIELEHQEKMFNVEKKSMSEILDHYKGQFEYQKTQSTKILDMHQKLLDTISQQNKLAIQRNIIEAAEKDVIKKDTWKTK